MKKLEFEESEYWDMVVQRNELLFALTFYAEGRHLSLRQQVKRLRYGRLDRRGEHVIEDGKLARSVIFRMMGIRVQR